MLSFLILGTVSVLQEQYSLTPPIITTDVNEIGNWTIRGTASNLKRAIRLTSDVSGSYGGICHRVPTLFKDWLAEFELSAYNGKKPGHGIWIFYTRDACQEFALQFDGFAFWINTTGTDKAGFSPVYFAKGNGSEISIDSLEPVGRVRVHDVGKPLRLQITRREGKFKFEAANGVINELIYETDYSGIPTYGYFTVSAATTKRVDINELISFRLFSFSPVDHPNITEDFSEINKKIIEHSTIKRREMKKRRRAKMPKMLNFTKQAKDATTLLTATNDTQINMTEALVIIREALQRTSDSISETTLTNFIQSNVEAVVDEALKKIKVTSKRFDETRSDIDDLWNLFMQKFQDLAVEEAKKVVALRNEVIEYAKSLNITSINVNKTKTELKAAASEVGENKVTNILLIISIVEINLYVIFFLYKRYQTDNFKKYE